MSDILERLRRHKESWESAADSSTNDAMVSGFLENARTMDDAASRIAELEAALRKIHDLNAERIFWVEIEEIIKSVTIAE